MFEDLNFDIDARIGDFDSVDALLNTLNSFVDQSQQIWSGISNEAPHQRLVENLKRLEAIRDGCPAKRSRTDILATDVLTGDIEGTDEEWFDAICSVMESSDFLDRFVKDTILKRRSPAKKTRKPYQNHNRTKDLWQTVWGQMLQDASFSQWHN